MPAWLGCTAVCGSIFGRDLYKALGGKVPIGLVASDWGGQRVECFSSADALADKTCGGTQPPGGTAAGAAPTTTSAAEGDPAPAGDEPEGVPGGDRRRARRARPGPSQLWNAMIHPLLPMRFTGSCAG